MTTPNIELLASSQSFMEKNKKTPLTTSVSLYNMLVFEDIVALLKCLYG